jgi:ectoine hydroxylase-related dioxygenase (phytanoyl-CoA dioxygenase family)
MRRYSIRTGASLNQSQPVVEPSERLGNAQADAVPWKADDQAWWDMYMTLAHNPVAPEPNAASPVSLERPLDRACARQVAAALVEPYPLADDQIAFFQREGYVRLPGVIPTAVLGTLLDATNRLLEAAYGTDTRKRFLALEQLWLTEPMFRDVALSRRLGDIAAQLLGVKAVRIYHDNILSKEPGCGRTPWHRDSDHYPLDSAAVCTSWIPLHHVPPELSPLACLPRSKASADLHGIPFSHDGTAYDKKIAVTLRSARLEPDATAFTAGEVSFHAADCFHTAGPNLGAVARRVLSSTYYADGVRVVRHPSIMSGAWHDFLPGVLPGELAVSALNPVVGASHVSSPLAMAA